MNVGETLQSAFAIAHSQNREIHKRWIRASIKIGGLIPTSSLTISVQRAGNIDVILRSIEDEFQVEKIDRGIDYISHYNILFSEIWVGRIYEITRLLRSRGLNPDNDSHKKLDHNLNLLRMPIDKHEIAKQYKLDGDLKLYKTQSVEEIPFIYNKEDVLRSYIMPTSLNSGGAVTWCAIDTISMKEVLINRRSLSDSFLDIWAPLE